MNDYCISIENITKKYKLGQPGSSGDGLRHSLERGVRSLFSPQTLFASKKAKETNEFLALQDVSFQVKTGEVLGIIGRNGAGKSTLLKVLSRITPPTSGKIRVRGRIASLLEVGTGFHPELTGRENIFLNGAILGMSRTEVKSKFDEIVAFAEIEKFLDTPVKRYSSGMYVRLAFAVAAHLEPEILVIDEVLAVGDVQFQKKCLGRMNHVARTDGRTVLFVSHNMGAVNTLCSKAVLLRSGQVQAIGPTAEIAMQYLSTSGLSAREISLTNKANKNPAITVIGGHLENKATGSSEFAHGDDLAVTLKIQVNEPITYGVEFFLKDGLGVPIGFCPSDIQNGLSFTAEPGIFIHHCTLSAIPLAEGRYSLDIMISKPLVTAHEEIESAFIFDVESSVFPGTVRRISQQNGYGALVLKVAFDQPIPAPESPVNAGRIGRSSESPVIV
jgi:lipopolysaccharide transport system ATP-binding protein